MYARQAVFNWNPCGIQRQRWPPQACCPTCKIRQQTVKFARTDDLCTLNEIAAFYLFIYFFLWRKLKSATTRLEENVQTKTSGFQASHLTSSVWKNELPSDFEIISSLSLYLFDIFNSKFAHLLYGNKLKVGKK
jgi:hypothetical protein